MRTRYRAGSPASETNGRVLEPSTPVRASAPAARAGAGPVRAGLLVATAACVLGLGAWASGAFPAAPASPVRDQAVARPLEMFRYAPSPRRTPQPVEVFRHTPRAPAIAHAPDPAPPPDTWFGNALPTLLAALAAAGPPALALASFLVAWGLVALAVALPAALPTLAAYGAAHRVGVGTRRPAPHAALFALTAAGLWLLTGVLVHLVSLAVSAAAAASPAVAAWTPYLLALGLAAVACYRLSPAHEPCRRATRRPAAFWVRRATPGYRGTLAVGWAHALASVGAGAPLVGVLVVGAAARPWAIAVAVLLFAERALPRAERTGLVAAGALLVLAVPAAVWPAPALAALRGTPPRAQPTATDRVLAVRRTLDGQDGAPTALAFSPDGALLASGGWSRDVLLWDAGTGRHVRALGRRGLEAWDDAAVSSIAFAPAGAAVAAGRTSGALTLWETATGHELRALRGPAVAALAFSPDGRTLAAGHAHGTVTFWEVSRGREVRTLRAQESAVDTLAFAPDGAVLATGGADRVVTLWDAASGRELRSLAAGYPVGCLAFSPDGRVLAAGGQGAATLWEVTTGGELLRLAQPATAAVVAFSPDGAVLTSIGFDGAVQSWTVATGDPTGNAIVPGALGLAALSTRRRILATTDLHRPRGESDLLENPVRIWDLQPPSAPGRR